MLEFIQKILNELSVHNYTNLIKLKNIINSLSSHSPNEQKEILHELAKWKNALDKSENNAQGEQFVLQGLSYQYGIGSVKNYQEALKLYNKAIELGNREAMLFFGGMYDLGYGVEQNDEEAFTMVSKSR